MDMEVWTTLLFFNHRCNSRTGHTAKSDYGPLMLPVILYCTNVGRNTEKTGNAADGLGNAAIQL